MAQNVIELLEQALAILKNGAPAPKKEKSSGLRWSKLPSKVYIDGEDTGQYKECDYLHIDDFNKLLEHKHLLKELPAKIITERTTFEYFKADKDQKFSEKQKKVLDIAYSELKKLLADMPQKENKEPKITEWSSSELRNTEEELEALF